MTERINEPPWGRCLQGAVDVRWVVVVVVVSSSPRTASSRALGITVTLLRSNGDASMGLDDGAAKVTKNPPKNSPNPPTNSPKFEEKKRNRVKPP